MFETNYSYPAALSKLPVFIRTCHESDLTMEAVIIPHSNTLYLKQTLITLVESQLKYEYITLEKLIILSCVRNYCVKNFTSDVHILKATKR